MTTVKEKFASDNLFSLMNTEKNFAWSENFTPEHMQNLFNQMYGNHVISDSFDTVTVADMAKELADFFVDRWNHIYSFMFDDTLLNKGFNETITETTVDDGTNTENGTDNTVNKVSAYNETEFQNDKSEDTTRETSSTNKNNRTRTYERSGYSENFSTARLKYLNMLQNDFIYGIIFKEVKSIITIPIYESEL